MYYNIRIFSDSPKKKKIILHFDENPLWKNYLLGITGGIWMSDPSGCVTYKPAALELYAPHANLPYNKMREPQKKKRQWIRDATQNILFERFGLRMVIWCVLLYVFLTIHHLCSVYLQPSSRRERWVWMTSSRSWCPLHISANSEYICFLKRKRPETQHNKDLWPHPDSRVFLFCFVLFWGFCCLIASPFMIHVQCRLATWTWQDVLWGSWGVIWVPRSQVKNSPFMTSRSQPSLLPNHLSRKSYPSPRRR